MILWQQSSNICFTIRIQLTASTISILMDISGLNIKSNVIYTVKKVLLKNCQKIGSRDVTRKLLIYQSVLLYYCFINGPLFQYLKKLSIVIISIIILKHQKKLYYSKKKFRKQIMIFYSNYFSYSYFSSFMLPIIILQCYIILQKNW